MTILDTVHTLNLPDCWISAGAVFQTIWNEIDNRPVMTAVHDIDITYFDTENSFDSSVKKDKQLEKFLTEQFGYEFDVHNEAYMHLWQGQNIEPYTSSENAMTRWIATVHAVGISGNSENIKILAPFGLEDIFKKIIRPIYHKDNNKALYDAKVAKWQARFNDLIIIPWEENII